MMKRFYTSFLLLMACFLCLTACSKKEVVKPETVVQQHIKALVSDDFENAAKLVYVPENISNPAAYQQKIRDVLQQDKKELDGRGVFQDVTIKDVLTRFTNGKVYNCDLNASYNIGARYYIREILAALPARDRLRTEAKVPQCSKRSTCTLSDLISLNAALAA